MNFRNKIYKLFTLFLTSLLIINCADFNEKELILDGLYSVKRNDSFKSTSGRYIFTRDKWIFLEKRDSVFEIQGESFYFIEKNNIYLCDNDKWISRDICKKINPFLRL